jgi:hypothetical protein
VEQRVVFGEVFDPPIGKDSQQAAIPRNRG